MLNVGIIGTGGISAAHISGYLEFPDQVRIVALCDIIPSRAEEKKRTFGLDEARVYDSLDALLADPGLSLDLISIATPPATHSPLTIQALDGGLNVVVEKPMAPSLQECDAMLATQRRSGRLLAVIAQNRFRDDMARLKAVLDSGKLGSVSYARITSAWWRDLCYYDLSWRGTWASEGGGCTLNHAIHHIDLALWLLGQPRTVTAMMTNAQHDNAEIEDLSVAILQYDRALAELTSSVVHHGEEQEIEIQAQRARISQPWRAVAELGEPNGFPTKDGDTALVAELDDLVASLPVLEHTGHAGELGDVIAAVRDRREPAITGEDGRRSIELVTAIYEAAIEGRVVELPLAPEDPYYRSGTLVARAPHFFEKTASVDSLDGEIIVGNDRG